MEPVASARPRLALITSSRLRRLKKRASEGERGRTKWNGTERERDREIEREREREIER